jgi:putative ABC transport system permease protein
LLDRPSRTAVSSVGVGFAIVLMFMQLGFLGAVGDTAIKVYQRTDCDLVIRSPEYLQVFDPRSVPAAIVPMIASIAEVADVRTLDLGLTSWRNPATGELRGVAIMGIDPERPALQIAELPSLAPLLRRPQHVLVDQDSRADYGPKNGIAFGPADIGVETEVSRRQVIIAGTFEMGTGLAANGAILVSHDGFKRLAPDRIMLPDSDQRVSMLLVRLHQGITASEGSLAIKERLARLDGRSSAFKVLPLKEAMAEERWHWYVRTPVGIIFAIGVAIAVIVGGVICYMVLAADVLARLPEYATLKAIGYSNGYLMRVLLGQASWLAGLAFLPAILASLLLYAVTSLYSGVEIRMTSDRIVLVGSLSLLMCGTAGWIALRKMTKAEPANLF